MPELEKRVPCHLIAGPLGVGKTTAVLKYLEQKQDDEYVAVLVNDFGEGGLDGVILRNETDSQGGGLDVVPVRGGCVCCTSSFYFASALEKLTSSSHVRRIIIEPSGIALLGQMKSLLVDLSQRLPLTIQPVIVLINPTRFSERVYTVMPYFQSLAREADVLVANRCDQASEAQVEEFLRWARALTPPKQKIVTTSFGRLPADTFALPSGTTLEHGDRNTHPQHLHGIKTGSRDWPPTVQFDLHQVLCMFQDWAASPAGTGLDRVKAVLHTTEGWQLAEIAQTQVSARPFPPQERSHMDWIATRLDEPSFIDAMDRTISVREPGA